MNDEASDVPRRGAERHAQANFAGPLADDVGHDTVDSGHGEADGEARENDEEQSPEARRGDIFGKRGFHGHELLEQKWW